MAADAVVGGGEAPGAAAGARVAGELSLDLSGGAGAQALLVLHVVLAQLAAHQRAAADAVALADVAIVLVEEKAHRAGT